MSERNPIVFTLSTRNLSLDGTRVVAGEHGQAVEVDAAAALTVLGAFAQLPALELLEAEARLYLAGPAGKVAVQSVGGRLLAVLVPEAANVAMECTPAQVLALVTSGAHDATGDAVITAAADEAELLIESGRRGSLAQRTLNSPWVLGGLAALAAAVAFFVFAPKTPHGVTVIRDTKRIAALHAELNGRYGAPGATVLELANGRLTGRAGAAGSPVLFQLDYRYGLRDTTVVVLTANEAELKVQTDGSLVFLSSSYPRQSGK